MGIRGRNMKIAIACDLWKEDTFRRLLLDAGYEIAKEGNVGKDIYIFHVETSNADMLYAVVQSIQKQCWENEKRLKKEYKNKEKKEKKQKRETLH